MLCNTIYYLKEMFFLVNYTYTKILNCVLTVALVFIFVHGTIISAYAENESTYTITIPSTLTVQNAGWNALTGGISVDLTNFDGKKLVVTASSDNGFKFVKSEDTAQTVSYNFCASSTDTTAITSWDFTASEKKNIGIVVENYSSKPAGTYNETVTFTAEIKNDGVPVTSVTITNAPTEALFVNSTGTLTATVYPENATDKTVTWSSSDPDYVSINETTGEYTIKGTKGYGSATITATAGGKTATCTITGKVTYTSLSVGTVLRTGDTFFTGGSVAFQTTPLMNFNASNGVITLVEATSGSSKYYKFQRGSNGTMPNVTAYKVTDNTDGVYITGGSGTSSSRFTLAVHTK